MNRFSVFPRLLLALLLTLAGATPQAQAQLAPPGAGSSTTVNWCAISTGGGAFAIGSCPGGSGGGVTATGAVPTPGAGATTVINWCAVSAGGGAFSIGACPGGGGGPGSYTLLAPGPTTLGGVFSSATVAHQWVTGIDTSGNATKSQPAFSDLAGQATPAQLPATVEVQGNKGSAGGYAGLDGGALVPIGQIPVGTAAGTVAVGNDARIVGAEQRTNKAAASGYASLDSTTHVPAAQLPGLTASAPGIVSASGGGTLNFLRADNTWVAPPSGGTPGGSSGQVQTNSGGVFGGLSNAALTALVNPFTPTLPGVVPASGGGTTSFLRADGSWVVPPTTGSGTPGGSSGQIQTNNAGAFGGVTIGGDATLNSSTGALTVTKINGTAPGTAAFQPTSAFDASGAAAARAIIRGAWAASTPYAVNDVFLQAGVLYQVTTAFTSGGTFSATNTTALAGAPVTAALTPSGSALPLAFSAYSPTAYSITLTANQSFSFTGATAGVLQSTMVVIKQDATGGRTVSFAGLTGATPAISTAANSVTALTFVTVDGGTTIIGGGGATAAGGNTGQVQVNASGGFSGITLSGDATLNTSTGAVTVTKINGATPGTAAFQATSAFDAAGVAATETSRATSAEGLLLPKAGGTLTGAITGPGGFSVDSLGRVANPVAIAVSAAGTTLGTATALTAQISQVTTASAGQGVVLATSAAVGAEQEVINRSGVSINVYPDASGDTIENGAAGVPIVVATGTNKRFIRLSSTAWASSSLTTTTAASQVGTYTASGALPVADTLSIVNSASAVTETLAAGTSDQQVHVIKRYGSGPVSITANIDGVSQTVQQNGSTAVRESLTLVWQAALSTYIAE